MATPSIVSSEFGQRLRRWRLARGLSQLELAHRADTTPRHVSFLETGRSRPGPDMILRLSESLAIPKRERNTLLRAAGLKTAFLEHDLDEPILQPYRQAIRMILEGHEPFPGSALDARGRVLLANASHRRMLPGAEDLSPEVAIDRFYAEAGPARILNWSEFGWNEADRRRRDADRLGSEELHRLADRAEAHLRDVPRANPVSGIDPLPIVTARWTQGDRILQTFGAVMRFDSARDITMSELRVELTFPADDETAAYFRSQARARDRAV
jgi:transcriptional regulator with XRE-family HTH domain